MRKSNKNIICFLVVFIIITSTSIAIFNPKEYKETNNLANDDNFNYDLSYLNTNQIPPPPPPPFIVGIDRNPVDLDPVKAFDGTSYNVIEQVCEGLFRYNLSDPNMPIINWLTEEYWWMDSITLQIKLREGVLFHDNTPFNATAAKWNLDRLLYLTNCTGTLPLTTPKAITEVLWRFPNGTAIINQVNVVNEYNITVNLNAPFGPLLDLLSHTNSYMLSPLSTPADDYIDLSTGYLVGTGPFIYDYYIPNIEINYHAFENYWQGKANINEMVFEIITDPTTRNSAMLAHTIDFLCTPDRSLFPAFEADSEISVTYLTDTYGIPSVLYRYLGFNNENINLTMRKAMSYAMNYTYIIEEMQNGEGIRANSPISLGYGDAFNSSTIAASRDLAKARQILKDAGIPGTASLTANNDTTGSVAEAWQAAEFAKFNYTYDITSTYRTELYSVLEDWFDQIGITVVEDAQASFGIYSLKLLLNPDAIYLFEMGWTPDYLDAFNTFDSLLNPISTLNLARVDDTQLMNMLEDALVQTDDTVRNNIYKNIQGYLATNLFPHAFLYHPKIYYVYSANLTNYPHNAMERLYFYPCELYTEQPPPPLPTAKIFIDDSNSNYNWSKTALENDWCTGSGTWNDPYVIKDIEIDGEFTYNGIEIYNSSVYFTIENCSINNAIEHGIHLVNTHNSLIYNNSLYDDSNIFLEYSHNHTISYNKILNVISMQTGGYGIMLSHSNHCEINYNSIESSLGGIVGIVNFDITILGNNLIDNSAGIGTGLVYNFTIMQNNVIGNSIGGIALQDSNETLIKDNVVTDSPNFGINFSTIYTGCHNNKIIGNQISNNGLLGLAFDDFSSQNSIYQNIFINNGLHAFDNGTLNDWNSTIIGNYWDNLTGPDTNPRDGIVDIPYTYIGGSAGSIDYLPIAEDLPPIITIYSPTTGSTFGETAPSFNISVSDLNLDTMWYSLDGGLHNYTFTTNGTINQEAWAALAEGLVTITFYANDTSGHISFEEVAVIKEIPEEEFDPTLIIIIVAVSVVGGVAVIVVVYIILKKRKAGA